MYQQHLIESMARSEREMKRRCLSLQNAIEYQNEERGFNPMINTAVHIDGGQDLSHTSGRQPRTTPFAKPRVLIGELLLSFQLLNDILGYHLAITEQSELSSLGYDELRTILSKIHTAEIQRLKAEYSSTSDNAKAEALQSLRTRLGELARSGLLTKGERYPSESKSKANQEGYDFDDFDESDLEAAVGLQALRIAEEQDTSNRVNEKCTKARGQSQFVDNDSEASDEDESEEVNEDTKGRRKRTKSRKNQFLDIEAEVSDDDNGDLQRVNFEDTNEAGSQARKLRGKAGERNSLVFDESLDRIAGDKPLSDMSGSVDTSTDKPGQESGLPPPVCTLLKLL